MGELAGAELRAAIAQFQPRNCIRVSAHYRNYAAAQASIDGFSFNREVSPGAQMPEGLNDRLDDLFESARFRLKQLINRTPEGPERDDLIRKLHALEMAPAWFGCGPKSIDEVLDEFEARSLPARAN